MFAAGLPKRGDWQNMFTGAPQYFDFDKHCDGGKTLEGQDGITTLSRVTDGMSNTIMWATDVGRPDYWEDDQCSQNGRMALRSVLLAVHDGLTLAMNGGRTKSVMAPTR